MADLSEELIPAVSWKSDREEPSPGLSKLSEREDHSSQKRVEFPGVEENPSFEENRRSPKGLGASPFGSFRAESRWNADDQAFARLAFIFFVVHLAGGLVLIAFYYNFAAFEVYIMSLFWAMIVSIPLYQVKMTIMRFIFSRLLRQTFVVVEVPEEHHHHHHRYKVLIRKLPWFYWLYSEKLAETEEPVNSGQNSNDIDDQQSEPSTVEAFVDREASEHLRKGLAEGKIYHAAIVASGSHPQQIEAHWEKRHWLGPFRPYASFMDIFRDLYSLYEGTEAFIVFMLKPFHQFSHQDDKAPLSAPYFGLLLRLCALQLLGRLWSRELQMKLMFVTFYTYLVVVSVRLAVWTIGVLTPIIWSKIPLSLRAASQQLQLLLKRMLTGSVSKWRKKLLDKAVQSFEENCHFLLSMLIIIAAMLLTVNFMSFLVISLRHEAEVIHRTCYGLLQKQEAYQTVMARLTHASDGDLFANLLAKLEEMLPDYELMLAKHIPDFYILKYVMYDLWTDEHSHAMSDAAHHQGPSPERARTCEEAVAHGASCNAEETIVMKHALRNTTALLRGLAAGNLTDTPSLLSGAFAEITSISSWFKDDATQSSTAEALKDGAAHGATLLARLTYFLPRVFLDMLASASSALGQTIVFMTALFYLLSAEESCLAVVGEFLRVVDQNQVIFAITEKVMRAVLVSAMKMSAFHALFTWLLYSFGQLPIVVVPTVLSAILALVPKVSPVWSISVWAAGYLWLHNQRICAALYFFVNLAVWWQVPTVIYAEIPEANAWLTGLGVVLGVGQFGLAGVVLGPLLASVPLICYNLVKLFNTLQWHQATESSSKRPSLFNLHQDFLPGASPHHAPSIRSERSSSSDSETVQPEASARSSPPTSPTSRARRSPASPERVPPELAPVPNGAVRRRNRMP